MADIKVNGVSINYEIHGEGKETIVFGHGLLLNKHMFDAQVDYFKDKYRCVAFDFRGHGKSEKANDGYDMDTLCEDTAALIQTLDCAPCHFVGLSMGGFVALRLAIKYPHLLKSVILLNTSAEAEPRFNLPKYKLLNFISKSFGLKWVVNQVLPVMFGKTFLKNTDNKEAIKVWSNHVVANDRIAIGKSVIATVTREGILDKISAIDMKTLIIGGEEDQTTPVKLSKNMQQKITNSQLIILPKTGHLAPIESVEATNHEIEKFLA